MVFSPRLSFFTGPDYHVLMSSEHFIQVFGAIVKLDLTIASTNLFGDNLVSPLIESHHETSVQIVFRMRVSASAVECFARLCRC